MCICACVFTNMHMYVYKYMVDAVVYLLSCFQRFCDPRLLCPWGFPGKNTGVGCHFLLQGIFLAQGLNPGLLLCNLYCWATRKAIYIYTRYYVCSYVLCRFLYIPIFCEHICACICMYVCTHTHIQTYTYIHTHKTTCHVCPCPLSDFDD